MKDKRPAIQFYVGDWRKSEVQNLDYEARGIWFEILLIMHESSRRGELVFASGEPMDDASVAQNLGIPEAKWKQTRSKIVRSDVADDVDGVLTCRRMLKERKLSKKRAEVGRLGGSSKRQANSKAKPKQLVEDAVEDAVEVVNGVTDKKKRKRRKYPPEFEEVWAIHRRGPKSKAFDEYLSSDITQSDLMATLRSYVDNELSERFHGHDLFRWIRDERWEQEQGRKPPKKPNGAPTAAEIGEAIDRLEAKRLV